MTDASSSAGGGRGKSNLPGQLIQMMATTQKTVIEVDTIVKLHCTCSGIVFRCSGMVNKHDQSHRSFSQWAHRCTSTGLCAFTRKAPRFLIQHSDYIAHAQKWFQHTLGWSINMTGPTSHFPGECRGAPVPVFVHVPVHLWGLWYNTRNTLHMLQTSLNMFWDGQLTWPDPPVIFPVSAQVHWHRSLWISQETSEVFNTILRLHGTCSKMIWTYSRMVNEHNWCHQIVSRWVHRGTSIYPCAFTGISPSLLILQSDYLAQAWKWFHIGLGWSIHMTEVKSIILTGATGPLYGNHPDVHASISPYLAMHLWDLSSYIHTLLSILHSHFGLIYNPLPILLLALVDCLTSVQVDPL